MMTIGQVLDVLEQASPQVRVMYNFGCLMPTTVDSWRGIYAEAALGYKTFDHADRVPTVLEMKLRLKSAIDGRKYSGWKGGEYSYTRDTLLHIDNPGEYSNTEISKVEIKEYEVIIHTEKEY
jgi:hypothetical protein